MRHLIAAVALMAGIGIGRTAIADVADTPNLTLTGYTQIDSVPWNEASVDEVDDDGEPLNQTRVVVRRARLRAIVVRGPWRGAIELDGNTINGAAARLAGAEVAWAAGAADVDLELRAGLMKIPFGGEVPLPDRTRDFLDTSRTGRALFPGNYDAGVSARATFRYVELTLAAMNGAPTGDAQFRGVDPTTSFDLLGRAGVRTGTCGFEVAAGVSALSGRGLSPGTPATADSIEWIDSNANGTIDSIAELQVIPGDPGTPSTTFDRRGFGGDLKLRWWLPVVGWSEAIAEVVVATNLDRGALVADPVADARDLDELGWHVGVVQGLGSRAMVGARVDRYHGDRDGTDPTWTTLAILAGWRRDDTRVVAEYDHERTPTGEHDRITIRAQAGF